MQILSPEAEKKLVDKTVDIIADMLERFMEGKYHEQRYLRADKLMEYTGIKSLSTIDRWKKKGLLNPIMIDGYVSYDKVEIDALMAKHKFTTK